MKYKLTKNEAKEIEGLISYYSTLGEDNDTKEGRKSEEAICSGLIKLKGLHDKKFAQSK